MPFKTKRIINSFKSLTGKSIPLSIRSKLSQYEHITRSQDKPLHVSQVISSLVQETSIETTKRIMLHCGTKCISKSIIQKAKRLYSNSSDINDFMKLLNMNHIGGGRLSYRNGTITGGYDKCYCGSVSKTKIPISIDYCNC